MGFFDQMGGGAPAAPAASGGPLAALASGDPRLLQQLLTAGQKAGGPQAMMPQPQGALQQLMMQAGAGGSPSDPTSFVHALIAMDQGQFLRMLATLGAGAPGGPGLLPAMMATNV